MGLGARVVRDYWTMAGRRGFESVRDMVLSLGVVLAFVAMLLLVTFRQSEDPVKVVDSTAVRQGVATNAPYKAVLPKDVKGWRITSARVALPGDNPFGWSIGFYTDKDTYVGIGQSNQETSRYLREEKADGEEVGKTNVGGGEWTKLEREDQSRRWLANTRNGVTTLIAGTGEFSELEKLANSLELAKTSG